MNIFPFSYLYNLRLHSPTKAISKAMIDIVTPAIILIAYEGAHILQLLSYTVFALGFYALYELGYIFNDLNDKAFTQRLDDSKKSHVKSKLPHLISIRILFYAICAAVSYLIYPSSNLFYALVLTCSTLTLFTIYNSMAQEKNITIYPALIIFRYITPYIYSCQLIEVWHIAVLLALYPIEIIIERIGWARFNIKPFCLLLNTYNKQLIFRILYFSALFGLSFLFNNTIITVLCGFLFIYRISIAFYLLITKRLRK